MSAHHHSHRYHTSKTVTLWGALMNVSLGILKIFFGWFGHSDALFADGVHSFGDLLTDIAVLLAAKAHSQGPDIEHPYGHGRIETVVTAAISVFLLAVGCGIVYQAIHELVYHELEVLPSMWVMVIAIISVLSNEIFFQWTVRIGKKIRSDMLIANAWHHRVDSLSSLVVLIGVGALFFFHWQWADRVAALLVGVLIIKMAISMSWKSICELVDTAADPETTQAIRACIEKTPGVLAVHMLRTRTLANDVFVDVHIQVAPRIYVSEGHYIGDLVMHRLRKPFPHIKDVTVHVDIEDDQELHPEYALLTRHTIEQKVEKACGNLPMWAYHQPLKIHYLQGQIHLEAMLKVPASYSGEMCQALAADYQARILATGIAKTCLVMFEFS